MTTESQSKGLVKFASSETDKLANPYGIKNSRGEIVTMAYLNRYVQCWCRLPEYEHVNRKANFAFFASPAFLTECIGLTASQVGHKASVDERWGLGKKAKRPIGSPAKSVASAPADQLPVDPMLDVPPAVEPTFEQTLVEETVASADAPAEAITPATTEPMPSKRGKRRSTEPGVVSASTLKAQRDLLASQPADDATTEAIKSIDAMLEAVKA